MADAATQIIKNAVLRSATDPAFFLRFFLSHWFPSALPPFHLGLLALLTEKVSFLDEYPEAHEFLLTEFFYEPDRRDPTAKTLPVFYLDEQGRICLNFREDLNFIIPRGFSKTTLCKGAVTYNMVTDSTFFGILIGATATHSETQVNDVKSQLESNEKLRAGYGNLVSTKADSEKWTSSEIQTKLGSILTARGRGGQVRGVTIDGKRPNLILMDDIEDEESIATSGQLKKTEDWVYGSVIPAGQIMEGAVGQDYAQRPLRVFNLGTLLGAECLVQTLTQDQQFGTVRFGAKLRNGKMLWKFKLSAAGYDRMRARWQRNGKLAQFTREYDSLIRVSDEALFPETFHYVRTELSDLVAKALALDPAISEDRRADHTALVVAARRHDGALWFLDEWGGQGKTPTETLDAFFEYQAKWNTMLNGIEAIQYQAALLFLAKEKMAKLQRFFVIQPIKAKKTSKVERIEGMLSPRYQMGYLYHYRPLPGIEGNLADWPNGKKDYADAGYMALSLLGETAGLLMDDALAPEPEQPQVVFPEQLQTLGNYIIHNNNNPLTSGRYG